MFLFYTYVKHGNYRLFEWQRLIGKPQKVSLLLIIADRRNVYYTYSKWLFSVDYVDIDQISHISTPIIIWLRYMRGDSKSRYKKKNKLKDFSDKAWDHIAYCLWKISNSWEQVYVTNKCRRNAFYFYWYFPVEQ